MTTTVLIPTETLHLFEQTFKGQILVDRVSIAAVAKNECAALLHLDHFQSDCVITPISWVSSLSRTESHFIHFSLCAQKSVF